MINTESYSSILRKRAVIPSENKVLIARLSGSKQEIDLTTPINCHGYGRIRHFRLYKQQDWSPDPLPILPAAKALKYSPDIMLNAQVFQNAACNWRCWYCFVDYDRLSADLKVSEYFTADELIKMYLKEEDRPGVIDLSGGQPDIVPEWIIWTMEAIKKYGLEGEIFLWSDDNLSTRYFWEYLTPKQRQFAINFRNYSRVACFKGYDETSFSFNTRAQPERFNEQFAIYRDLLKEGFDMYAYVTFTSLPHSNLSTAMEIFVDMLQNIHPNLPLRTVPLRVDVFAPTKQRITSTYENAIKFQYDVHSAWVKELRKRFSEAECNTPICDVEMQL